LVAASSLSIDFLLVNTLYMIILYQLPLKMIQLITSLERVQ